MKKRESTRRERRYAIPYYLQDTYSNERIVEDTTRAAVQSLSEDLPMSEMELTPGFHSY